MQRKAFRLLPVLLGLMLLLCLGTGALAGDDEVFIENGETTTVELGKEIRNVSAILAYEETPATDYLTVSSDAGQLAAGTLVLNALDLTVDGDPILITYNCLDVDHTDWAEPAEEQLYVWIRTFYPVNVDPIANATVEVDAPRKGDGDKVYVTVTPAPLFSVDEICYGSEYFRSYVWIEDGHDPEEPYEFIMPDEETTVYVKLKCEAHYHSESGIIYTELEDFTGGTLESGYYELEDFITLNQNIVIAKGSTVHLCLNGYGIDLNGYHISNSGNLTLEDCDENEEEYYYQIDETTGKLSRAEDEESSDGVFYYGSIYNGESINGGGIANLGQLKLSRIMVLCCETSGYGGGIENSGSCKMDHCFVVFCRAQYGGGISNNGSLLVDVSVITGNTAVKAGGGIWHQPGPTELLLGTSFQVTENRTETSVADVYKTENIYLCDGTVLSFDPDMEYAGMIYAGVTTQTAPTAGSPVPVTAAGDALAEAYGKYLESDDTSLSMVPLGPEGSLYYALSTHQHSWNYTVEDADAVAICADETAHSQSVIQTLTIYPPSNWSLEYNESAFEAFLYCNTRKNGKYAVGDVLLSDSDIYYKQQVGESWVDMEEAPVLPGTYRACVDIQPGKTACVDFTVEKAQNYFVTYGVTGDVLPGKEPQYFAAALVGEPEVSYSKTEDGTYGSWEEIYDGPGTYFMKLYIPGSDLYTEAEEILEVSVPECAFYEPIEDNTGVGYLMLGGKPQEGLFMVWEDEDGWVIQDWMTDLYLAPDGEGTQYSEEPYYWQYDGGFYVPQLIPPAAAPILLGTAPAGLYLADGLTLSNTKVLAQLMELYLGDHEPGTELVNNGDGTHSHLCEGCGEPADRELHSFDPQTGLCECGAKRPDMPATGDETLLLPVCGLLLCLAAAGTLYVARKNRRRV